MIQLINLTLLVAATSTLGQAGDEGVRALTTSRTPITDSISPALMLKAGTTPDQLARQSNSMRPGTRYIIIMDDPRIVGHPRDYCKTPRGGLTVHPSPWLKAGVLETRMGMSYFFKRYHKAGGELDGILLDMDRTLATESLGDPGSPIWKAIQNDPRFNSLSAQLGTGTITPMKDGSPEEILWNYHTASLFDDALKSAIQDPLQKIYPDAGLANRGSYTIEPLHASVAASPDVVVRNGTGFGSHESEAFYGLVEPGSGTHRFRGGVPLGEDPYGALLREVHRCKGIINSNPDRQMLPWIAPRSWTGTETEQARLADGPYWRELVMHLVMSGCDQLVFRTDLIDQRSAGSEVEYLDDLLEQVNQQLGDEAGRAILSYQHDFDKGIIVTGRKTAEGNLWRITAREDIESVEMILDGRPVVVQIDDERGAWYRQPSGTRLVMSRLGNPLIKEHVPGNTPMIAAGTKKTEDEDQQAVIVTTPPTTENKGPADGSKLVDTADTTDTPTRPGGLNAAIDLVQVPGDTGSSPLIEFRNIGFSSDDPLTRHIGHGVVNDGWDGFIQQHFVPAYDWGVRRFWVHNPFGARHGESMQWSQYLQASHGTRPFRDVQGNTVPGSIPMDDLTNTFVRHWKAARDSGQFEENVQLCAYIGTMDGSRGRGTAYMLGDKSHPDIRSGDGDALLCPLWLGMRTWDRNNPRRPSRLGQLARRLQKANQWIDGDDPQQFLHIISRVEKMYTPGSLEHKWLRVATESVKPIILAGFDVLGVDAMTKADDEGIEFMFLDLLDNCGLTVLVETRPSIQFDGWTRFGIISANNFWTRTDPDRFDVPWMVPNDQIGSEVVRLTNRVPKYCGVEFCGMRYVAASEQVDVSEIYGMPINAEGIFSGWVYMVRGIATAPGDSPWVPARDPASGLILPIEQYQLSNGELVGSGTLNASVTSNGSQVLTASGWTNPWLDPECRSRYIDHVAGEGDTVLINSSVFRDHGISLKSIVSKPSMVTWFDSNAD